jgi:hypothetical protein
MFAGLVSPMKDRLISVAASLVFSIPTAVLIWVVANVWITDGALGPVYLLAIIAIFAFAALAAPEWFPDMLGKLWRWLARLGFLV